MNFFALAFCTLAVGITMATCLPLAQPQGEAGQRPECIADCEGQPEAQVCGEAAGGLRGTFRNICSLLRHNCRYGTTIVMVNEGPCVSYIQELKPAHEEHPVVAPVNPVE